jgi:hypothetical protein
LSATYEHQEFMVTKKTARHLVGVPLGDAGCWRLKGISAATQAWFVADVAPVRAV